MTYYELASLSLPRLDPTIPPLQVGVAWYRVVGLGSSRRQSGVRLSPSFPHCTNTIVSVSHWIAVTWIYNHWDSSRNNAAVGADRHWRVVARNTARSAHAISLLYTMFALATLFDATKSPGAVEAEECYVLASAAMGLAPPTMHTTLWAIW